MKNYAMLFLASILIISCGRKGEHDHHGDETSEDSSPNDALYNEVQEIHMDAMAYDEKLMALKGQISEKTKSATLTAEKKQELLKFVSEMDSIHDVMMAWMRQWMQNPPDSADVEKRREYFESQMEAIKKIRDVTNESIEKAKEEVGKN